MLCTPQKISFDDIWTPDQPLPVGSVLYRLAARCGEIWQIDGFETRVRIAYNPKLRSTLGRAWLEDMKIELNTRLLLKNPDQLIPTVVHELAHLGVRILAGKRARPHGREFKILMHQAGQSSRATHSLDVSAVKRARKRFLYLHTCDRCKRYFTARSVRRNVYCGHCGPKMTWNIIRVVNSVSGKKTLSNFISQIENGELSARI